MTSTDGKVHALILQHEEATPGGLVLEWLNELGAEIHEHRIDVAEDIVDPGDYHLIISLGSEYAAFDDSVPWLAAEIELFRDAADKDVPVLGICFGGQLLARVHGGDSYRGDMHEVGWFAVDSADEELVPRGPWFQWHFDTFTLPPGAKLLAENEVGPQAFLLGRSMGVQFHPEVTPEIMDEWVRVYRHELDDVGVDPDELLAETLRLAGSTRSSALQLLRRFESDIAKLGNRAGEEGS